MCLVRNKGLQARELWVHCVAWQISYEIASIQLAVMSLEEEAGRPVDKIQGTYQKVRKLPPLLPPVAAQRARCCTALHCTAPFCAHDPLFLYGLFPLAVCDA